MCIDVQEKSDAPGMKACQFVDSSVVGVHLQVGGVASRTHDFGFWTAVLIARVAI